MGTDAHGAAAQLETTEYFEFIYQPLSDASTDFRLLRVLPDRQNGRTQVEMWNVSSIQTESISAVQPNYQCLSYTWGAPDYGPEILLNGSLFHVRRNLFDFLEQAAQTLPKQPLWIDALCIDQSSLHEKNIQVTRMGQIYKRAFTVLVWLGKNDSLMPIARYLARDKTEQSEQDAQEEREVSFAAFWDHTYWTRAWVTQELLLAESIQVQIGTYTFDWRCINSILDPRFLMTHRIYYIADFDSKRNLYGLVAHRQEHPSLSSQTIWDLLRWRYNTACSIAHDRIYALLSIVQNGAGFRVSYEEDPASLFWRAGDHFHAWSNVHDIQRLRIALRLTRHELQSSMSPTEPLVLELRAATAQSDNALAKTTICSRCRVKITLSRRTDMILCSKLTNGACLDPPSHVLVRREDTQTLTSIGANNNSSPSANEYTAKVVYEHYRAWDGYTQSKHFALDRALTYRVGEDWVRATDTDLGTLRSGQDGEQRWAAFLPADHVLLRLETLESSGKYPWWEQQWPGEEEEEEDGMVEGHREVID